MCAGGVCHNGSVASTEQIRSALTAVIDPELRRSIVELDMVRSIDVGANGVVDVTVSLTTPGCPIRGHFQRAVTDAVSRLDGVSHCNVYFDVLSDAQKATLQQKLGRASLPEGTLARVRLAWRQPSNFSMIEGLPKAGGRRKPLTQQEL